MSASEPLISTCAVYRLDCAVYSTVLLGQEQEEWIDSVMPLFVSYRDHSDTSPSADRIVITISIQRKDGTRRRLRRNHETPAPKPPEAAMIYRLQWWLRVTFVSIRDFKNWISTVALSIWPRKSFSTFGSFMFCFRRELNRQVYLLSLSSCLCSSDSRATGKTLCHIWSSPI